MTEEDRLKRARAAVVVAGVDAGKFQHAIVARAPGGAAAKALKFAVDRPGFEEAVAYVLAFAAEVAGRPVAPAECLVGIEFAGSAGFTLAHHFDTVGFPVVNVLSYTTKRESEKTHRRKHKTDAADAAIIAKLVANGEFAGFPFLDPAYARLRQLTSALERLSGNVNMAVTRLRHALHQTFPELEALVGDLTGKVTPLALLTAYPSPRALLAAPEADVYHLVWKSSRGQLREPWVAGLLAAARRTVGLPAGGTPGDGRIESEVPLLVEQIRLFERQYADLAAEVKLTLDTLPEAAALRTIDDLGEVTIGAILGTLGDVRAYRSAVQVQRLAGLDLTERGSSGTKESRPTISRSGHPVLRRYLYLAAFRMVSTTGMYRRRYEAMLARNIPGTKAIVGIARHLLELLYTVARTGEPFDRVRFDRTAGALPLPAGVPVPAPPSAAELSIGASTRSSRRQRRKAAIAAAQQQVVTPKKGTKGERVDLRRAWRKRVQEATAEDARVLGLTPVPERRTARRRSPRAAP